MEKTIDNYDHRGFITKNKIDKKGLPSAIQKKMGIFDEMANGLHYTVGEDAQTLRKKLTKLDEELYEDLLDEFEDELQHNEFGQVEANGQILENLYRKGKLYQLSKSFLKDLGLKVDFNKWEIHVGPYILVRQSIFSFHFKLKKRM